MRVVLSMAVAAVLSWAVAAVAADAMEVREIGPFLADYHRNPEPERIPALLAALDERQMAEDDPEMSTVLTGFFYELLKRHPDRMAAWAGETVKLRSPRLKNLVLTLYPAAGGALGRMIFEPIAAAHPELGVPPPLKALEAKQLEQTLAGGAEGPWGGWSASGNPAYARALLRQSLAPASDEAALVRRMVLRRMVVDRTGTDAELLAVTREFFQAASPDELDDFFKMVPTDERERILGKELAAKVRVAPQAWETGCCGAGEALAPNRFEGLFRDWSRAETNREYQAKLISCTMAALLRENPRTDPQKLRAFLLFRYDRGKPDSSDGMAATENPELFDEAWRLAAGGRGGDPGALFVLLRRAPKGTASQVELIAWYCDMASGPERNKRQSMLFQAMAAAIASGRWQGMAINRFWYNRLDRICNHDEWLQLEADVKPNAAQADPWLWEMIQGRAGIARAWKSRGGDWGYKVTDEGWKGFQAGLESGRTHLLRALALEPDRAEAHIPLIAIEMGDGDRDEMLGHFMAAAAAIPDHDRLYSQFVWALLPRWGGSHRQIRQLALAAMDCPNRRTSVPAMGLGFLGEIAWDYPDATWPNLYRDPEVQRRATEIFREYVGGAGSSDRRDFLLRRRMIFELVTLQYEAATQTLAESGGAEKMRRHPDTIRDMCLDRNPGVPYYDDPLRHLTLFTGQHGAELREIEKIALDQSRREAHDRLLALVDKADFSPEDRDYLLNLAGRWQLDLGPQHYCEGCGRERSWNAFQVAGKDESGDIAVMREMLGRHFRYREYENFPGETAILVADVGKNPDALNLLKEAGDPLTTPEAYNHQRTPLHNAAAAANLPMIGRLLDLGVPIDAVDDHKHTPLHLATAEKKWAAAAMLLQRGADINAQDQDGDTVLIFLPQINAPASVYHEFLTQPKVKVNLTNGSGSSALHIALLFNASPECLRELIAAGADVNLRDRSGLSPLTIARQKKNAGAMALLRAAGAR